MTNPRPYDPFPHPVDPDWYDAPINGRPQLSHLLGHLGLQFVHRGLLRAALPGRNGHTCNGKGLAETYRFGRLLKSWEAQNTVLRVDADTLEVRDSRRLRLFALDRDIHMPRDGATRAFDWAAQGTTPLHQLELAALARFINTFHDLPQDR